MNTSVLNFMECLSINATNKKPNVPRIPSVPKSFKSKIILLTKIAFLGRIQPEFRDNVTLLKYAHIYSYGLCEVLH